MEGWIKLHRKIQEHWIWQDDKYFKWWNTILLNVNHDESKFPVDGELMTCFPGQSFRSIQSWTDLFGCSKKTTISFLKLLKKDAMISTEIVGNGNRRKHLLTVVNWKDYQIEETENYTEKEPKTTPKRNPKVTSNKNDKNVKNDKNFSKNIKKNLNILLSQVDESTLDETTKVYYQIAISFFELIKSNLAELNISSPEIEKADFEKWMSPVKLLIEKDKRNIEEFREVFNFLKNDDFWKAQVRSTTKLRKKDKNGITYFEVLLIKARNEKSNRNKSTQRNSQSGVSDEYRRSILERLRNPKRPEIVKED